MDYYRDVKLSDWCGGKSNSARRKIDVALFEWFFETLNWGRGWGKIKYYPHYFYITELLPPPSLKRKQTIRYYGGHCFTMKCLRGYWIDIHWFFPTNIDCGVSQVWRSKNGVWRFSWYLQISLMWLCLCTNLEKWYKMLDSQEMIRRWLGWKGISISRQWIHQRKQGKKFHVWLISLNER